LDIAADLSNDSSSFLTDHKRQLCGVAALAVIHVNEIDADGYHLYHSLVRLRMRCRQIAKLQNLRATGL
jgi:hypothetical protein